MRNIVLVHGAFVDGSGWQAVYHLLRGRGYNVSVVQHSTATLADDVRAVRQVLAAQDGPAVLVGHSYGGAVITEAGTDDRVAALVYVTAFAPDAGESVAALTADPPPNAPVPPLLPPRDGLLLLDREKFAAAFAADVDPELAAFMADAQLPWGLAAVQAPITQPAWRSKPSWYLVARDDRMIPAAAQRAMAGRAGATISESAGSHCVFISQPEAVARVITAAAGVAEPAVA